MNWNLFQRVLLAGLLSTTAAAIAADRQPLGEQIVIQVGIDQGDVVGSDHRALQAAVDYAASLGGGTVQVAPGKYTLRNALTLRSNVRIVGTPGQTVLAACDGLRVPLAADGDANERQITVAEDVDLRIGDGVSIQDRNAGGFEVTTATLIARVGPKTFRLSKPLYLDYLVSNQASACLTFPVIGGWNVENVVIEGVTIEGNRDRSQPLNGCRGGGIYLFECSDVAIRNCTVRNYNGDGISFQVSSRVTVENCVVENNQGLGLHPGSGSQHPVVRGNRSTGNGQDGLFVCWRVKHGVFEHNEIRGNQRIGISIGHKDTDNVFRHNVVAENAQAGVFFRNESEAMGAHRNVFEDNRIVDNGRSKEGNSSAAVIIRGPHHDVVFRRNTIGNTSKDARSAGILASSTARGLTVEDNEFLNVAKEDEVKVQQP